MDKIPQDLLNVESIVCFFHLATVMQLELPQCNYFIGKLWQTLYIHG